MAPTLKSLKKYIPRGRRPQGLTKTTENVQSQANNVLQTAQSQANNVLQTAQSQANNVLQTAQNVPSQANNVLQNTPVQYVVPKSVSVLKTLGRPFKNSYSRLQRMVG